MADRFTATIRSMTVFKPVNYVDLKMYFKRECKVSYVYSYMKAHIQTLLFDLE